MLGATDREGQHKQEEDESVRSRQRPTRLFVGTAWEIHRIAFEPQLRNILEVFITCKDTAISQATGKFIYFLTKLTD